MVAAFVSLFLISLFVLLIKNKDSDLNAYQIKGAAKDVTFGKLVLTAKPTSKDMVSGTLCLDGISKVKKIDLFMPDMGHGSAPPTVSETDVPEEFFLQKQGKTDFGCVLVERMELFMPGLWQVRVFSDSNEMGHFDVNLSE